MGILKLLEDSSKLKIKNITVEIVAMEHILEAKAIRWYLCPSLAYPDIFGSHKDVKSRDSMFSSQFATRQFLKCSLARDFSDATGGKVGIPINLSLIIPSTHIASNHWENLFIKSQFSFWTRSFS